MNTADHIAATAFHVTAPPGRAASPADVTLPFDALYPGEPEAIVVRLDFKRTQWPGVIAAQKRLRQDRQRQGRLRLNHRSG